MFYYSDLPSKYLSMGHSPLYIALLGVIFIVVSYLFLHWFYDWSLSSLLEINDYILDTVKSCRLSPLGFNVNSIALISLCVIGIILFICGLCFSFYYFCTTSEDFLRFILNLRIFSHGM